MGDFTLSFPIFGHVLFPPAWCFLDLSIPRDSLLGCNAFWSTLFFPLAFLPVYVFLSWKSPGLKARPTHDGTLIYMPRYASCTKFNKFWLQKRWFAGNSFVKLNSMIVLFQARLVLSLGSALVCLELVGELLLPFLLEQRCFWMMELWSASDVRIMYKACWLCPFLLCSVQYLLIQAIGRSVSPSLHLMRHYDLFISLCARSVLVHVWLSLSLIDYLPRATPLCVVG